MRSIGMVLMAVGGFLLYLVAVNKVTDAMSALFTGQVPGSKAADPSAGIPKSIFDDPNQDASGSGVRA